MFKFSFQRLFNSFRFAFRGLKIVFEEEQSFLIQFLAALAVIFLMFYLGLTAIEKVVLLLGITFILVLEIINTTIERILNFIEPNFDPRIGKIKDLVSAVVLFGSIGVIIGGLWIFLPYFQKLFSL